MAEFNFAQQRGEAGLCGLTGCRRDRGRHDMGQGISDSYDLLAARQSPLPPPFLPFGAARLSIHSSAEAVFLPIGQNLEAGFAKPRGAVMTKQRGGIPNN